MKYLVRFVFGCVVCWSASAISQTLPAATPPMGWNSWDSWGMSITEAQFKATVDWAHHYLQPFGWRYMVIDEGWYLQHPEDRADQGYTLSGDGRYLPALDRFPSAAGGNGFRPIADYVHSLGLKFGIHIIRGIPKLAVKRNLPIAGSSYHAADAVDPSDDCKWDDDNCGVKAGPAGQAYYDSLLRLYASWGVDFLKVDSIARDYKKDESHMIREAMRKVGRPMVLSLSPGPTPLNEADDVIHQANMWRISRDVWDLWLKPAGQAPFPQALRNQFPLLAEWEPYAGPGHWPDADMLPIGELGPHPGYLQPRASRLTHDEERTMVTLWSIARSPLFLGADLTRMDPFTTALVTNPEVIAVDQHSIKNHALLSEGDTTIWTAVSPDGAHQFLAIFNLSDSQSSISYSWRKLGLSSGSHPVRDLWKQQNLQPVDQLTVVLPPHGSALYRIQ
ncbi:MAG: glycoside hydrolase family 27 protein [Acidobacteriaceae bacterium]